MPDIDIAVIDIDLTRRLYRECTPKLLVVTDGGLDAGPGGFGLSRFVNVLKNITIHGMKPNVVTRPRTTPANPPQPDDAFDDLHISGFDVVFLFGFNNTPLSSTALDRISRFMEAGGGVFATGDHADLGFGMSGAIPRVRNMRHWKLAETPSAGGSDRLTTNLSGANREFEFGDQSDDQPQRLYANFAIPSDYPIFDALFPPNPEHRPPHPLVRMADGSALDVYPDHPHEGECRIPTDFTTSFDLDGETVPEWPDKWPFARPRPRVVASTMSFGNGFPGKAAVAPRAFISIAAYDGQAAAVGRVVTDATWHHYVNINLDGMVVGGQANADLERIQSFWSNLATWLMPAETRKCLWSWFVVETLRQHPLSEEIRIPEDRELDLDELHAIGRAVLAAAGNRPGGAAQDLIADVLGSIIEHERASEQDVELGVSDAVLDAVSAVVGSYVVDVARAAVAGKLTHDHDGFGRAVRAAAPKLVDSILETHREQLKRRAEGLEILSSLFEREPVPA